jgi:hypothetical protein
MLLVVIINGVAFFEVLKSMLEFDLMLPTPSSKIG